MGMNPTRTMLGLVLLAGGLAAAMALRPQWLTRAEGQPGSPLCYVEVAPPDKQCLLLARRIRLKAAISRQVADGEMRLLEAALLFRDLEQDGSDSPGACWQSQPGKSEGEKACRMVISWAVAELTDTFREDEAPALQGRLEKELKALIDSDGEVRLPAR